MNFNNLDLVILFFQVYVLRDQHGGHRLKVKQVLHVVPHSCPTQGPRKIRTGTEEKESSVLFLIGLKLLCDK